jgi:hypothetical protein
MPEDFFESEVAVAVAVTAAVFSPRVRGVLRQGLVYGVAGATVAANSVTGATRTVGRAVGGVLPIGIGRSDNGSASSASPARSVATRASRGATSPRASRARTTRRPAAARAKATTRTPAATPTSASAPASDS